MTWEWELAGRSSSDGAHTIGRWLTDRAVASPERIAIDDRGVTISYRDLEGRAHELSLALRRAGYGAGDRIATVSGNSIDHVVAFFACAKAGIAFVPLSWRMTARELVLVAQRADAQLVLVEDEYQAVAADALREMDSGSAGGGPPIAGLGTTGVEASVPLRDGRFGIPRETRAVLDDDPLLIIFTSGSEATPKGVVLTHANCFWNNIALAGAVQLTAEDVVLAMLPQFHVAAWNCEPLLAWWVGATVVLERSFQPSRVLQLLQERRVTTMMGVPTQYQLLADDGRFASSDLSHLRTALVGGATMPASLVDTWTQRGVTLTQGYGLTEAGPNVLCLTREDAARHPGAVGRPYPHVEVCLADPQTGEVCEGAGAGELWVRGPSVFAEYLGDPEATERAHSGEWLRTGDLAARDADGVYRIVDRLKDIFISGGENVAPAEVEHALMLHPAIEAAAVVGVPDRVWGERGVAFVVATEPLDEAAVLTHARSVLAGFKVPIRVAFLDELPRSTIDKVARPRLRDRAQALVEEEVRRERS